MAGVRERSKALDDRHRVLERRDRIDEIEEDADPCACRLGDDLLVFRDGEVGVVLQEEHDVRALGGRHRAAKDGADVLSLGFDQLGAAGQVGAVKPGDDPQERAAEGTGALEPGLDAADPHRGLVALPSAAQEVARGEDHEAEGSSTVRERLELIQLEPANVVEVHLDALGPRLGRLLEDLRRRDAPGLEPQVPAERVGAQTDGH